jgi:threonine aldolase
MLSGVQLKAIRAERGVIDPAAASASIRPGAYYFPRTKLISVENTHGRSAGAVYPVDKLRALSKLAEGKKIPLHMDGARLWNACAASGLAPSEYAACASSVSVCFSKGLGAPVGSAVAGDRAFIGEARRIRKIFGGGMRQAGVLAAAALYALTNNRERLAEDHANARVIASRLKQVPGIEILPVETNMVIVDLGARDRDRFLERLSSRGVLLTPEGSSSIRAVTHLDVSAGQVEQAAGIIAETVSERA